MAVIKTKCVMRLDELHPYENNARVHSEEQVEQIAASIQEFGFINPILIDPDGGIIAGHGRFLAAKLLGMDVAPCLQIDGLTEAQKRAFILADNRLTELGGWDMDIVNAELAELDAKGFDVLLTGFELGSESDLEDEEKYTPKTDIPQYEPSGDITFVEELVSTDKTDRLLAEIAESGLPESEKAFLQMAAYRHLKFNYAKIADYYAQASEDMQELMEHSALVIIDFEDAIRDGYVELSSALAPEGQEG